MLIGDARDRSALLAASPSTAIDVVDPTTDTRLEPLASTLYERRRKRGMTMADALELAATPLIFAALMVEAGEADGGVAGAAHPTADVIRAGLWAIGPAAGIHTVSSSFYMVTPPFRSDVSEVLTFTDAGVVPNPTADQLAEIAVAAASARRSVVGDEPRVAFLSYSTLGSAPGERPQQIRNALERFRVMAPCVEADGELQADAALIPEIAAIKAPGSAVAGRANVLVFPDLDSANIAYKLVQRLANAVALGPIIQGFARPFNDLSRGATSDDIINVACITSLMCE